MKIIKTLVISLLLFGQISFHPALASAQDYETVVVEYEREKVQSEASAKRHEAIAKEKKEYKEIFEAKYKSETRVYRPATISAQSAKELIDPELATYRLLPFAMMDGPVTKGAAPKIWRLEEKEIEQGFGLVILEKSEFYYIARHPRKLLRSRAVPMDNPLAKMMLTGGLALTEESAIADARTDSLLVTALPETHDKVRAIIERMDRVMKMERSRDTIRRYRIEVALLQGWINGDGPTTAPKTLAPEQKTEINKATPKPTKTQTLHPSQPLIQHAGETLILDDIAIDRDGAGLLVLNARYIAEPEGKTRIHPDYRKLVTKATQYSEAIKPMIEGVEFTISAFSTDSEKRRWAVRYTERPRAAPKAAVPSATPQPSKGLALAAQYGISRQDLETFGLTELKELGKGIVYLLGEKGETMNPTITFPGGRSCVIQYQDLREPYLIIKGNLFEAPRFDLDGQGIKKNLIESTVFLELDKPTVLGLTNLREALILTIRWQAVTETTTRTKKDEG